MRWNKIFGIGFSQTGTTSLTKALQTLGLNVIHAPPRLSEVIESDGATDVIVAQGFRDLDRWFPGSGFILTLREMSTWLESAEYQASLSDQAPETDLGRVMGLRRLVYGVERFNREVYKSVHFNHICNVLDHFQEDLDRLLVMDICAGHGWERLCPFLDEEIPTVPFPYLNQRSPGQRQLPHRSMPPM